MKRRLAALLAAAAAAAGAAGCGAAPDIDRGGRVSGTTLTIYSLLPDPGTGASHDMIDAEKLAVKEQGGLVGPFNVNFISIDEGAPGAAGDVQGTALALRDAIADPQVIALIGPEGSATAMATVPLLNAAGILEISPGAGYAGFTEPVAPGEPARWQPAGRITFARLAGDDTGQARALLAAAGSPRVAVEQEPGAAADGLVADLRSAGARIVTRAKDAAAVIYAGEDPVNAAGALNGLAREAPHAKLLVPDALTRAGIAGQLSAAARKRAIFLSVAPAPGSTPALQRFEAAFRAQFGRTPSPYAAIGHEAMRGVLAAIAAAGPQGGSRQAVIDAYFNAPERRGTPIGDYAIAPDGRRDPAPFTAYRLRPDGSRAAVPLGS